MKLTKILKEEVKPLLKMGSFKIFKTIDGGLSVTDDDRRIVFIDKQKVSAMKNLLNRMSEF